jgi:hypothetical protein
VNNYDTLAPLTATGLRRQDYTELNKHEFDLRLERNWQIGGRRSSSSVWIGRSVRRPAGWLVSLLNELPNHCERTGHRAGFVIVSAVTRSTGVSRSEGVIWLRNVSKAYSIPKTAS